MRVLIAVDDSPCSQAAIDSVVDRSWPEGSEFRVISVVEPLAVQYGFAGAYGIEAVVEVEKQLQESRKRYVNEKITQLSALFGKGRVCGEVIEGYVADEILDDSFSWDADLIVVGSHGRKGIQKFLLGSIAERIVSHASCSVEVARCKGASAMSSADQAKQMAEKDYKQAKFMANAGKQG